VVPAPAVLGRLPALLLVAVAVSAIAFRLATAPSTPATFDEVSFLIALERYDLLAFEPHFPGYPLTVLLARAAQGLGAQTPYAALNAAVLVPALMALFRLAGGSWRGLWAATLFAWAPLAVHEALRPLSDTLAASLAVVAIALLIPPRGAPRLGRLMLGALVLGASAAAKPDHALLLAFLILPLRRCVSRGLAWAGVSAIVLAWAGFGLAALAAGCGGLEPALEEGFRFLGGHLGEWGGLAESSPRIVYAAAPLGDFAPTEDTGWGSLGIRLASVLALSAAALRAPRWLRRALLIGALPYALWLLFGQTLSHPRHALVLAPLLFVLAARGLPRSRFGVALACLLLGGALNATLQRSPTWREGARPIDHVVAELERAPPRTRLYAGASARALQHRLPTHDVRRVRDLKGLRADLAASPLTPADVWVLPEVLDPASHAASWQPLAWEEIPDRR